MPLARKTVAQDAAPPQPQQPGQPTANYGPPPPAPIMYPPNNYGAFQPPPPMMMMAPPPPMMMEPPSAAPVGVMEPLQAPAEDTKSIGQEERFKGPLSAKRSCTDILCFFMFIIVAVGFVAVCVAGFLFGDPFIMFYGHNVANEMCGVGALRDYKKVFAFDPVTCIASSPSDYMTKGCQPSVCIKECPAVSTWNWNDHGKDLAKDIILSDSLKLFDLCLPEVKDSTENLTVEAVVKAGKCPPYVFPSSEYLFRCEPSFLSANDSEDIWKEAQKVVNEKGNSLNLEQAMANLEPAHNSLPFISDVMKDLGASWPHILAFTGMTMLVSLIWIFFMRFFGPFLIWFSVLVIVLGNFAATAMLWIIYDALVQGYDKVLGIIPVQELTYIPNELWLVFGLLSSLLSLIFLILFCALFNRIRLAAAIVTESSRAIAGSMLALIWPVIPFTLQLGTHSLFLLGLLYFLTATSTTDTVLDAKVLERNIYSMWPVLISLLFAWFWITNFILALNYTTLAGSFGSWYWNHGTKDSESLQLFAALWRAVRYHLGSMAFGALIVAIVQTIRAVLHFFEHQFRKMKNPIGVILLKCLICCVWCVEKLLKFITKNAYIMVALKGKNFCYSARKAFKLIVENAVRIVVLDTVSSVLIAISVFVIVGGVSTLALFVFYPSLIGWTLPPEIDPKVTYFYIPLIVEIIASLMAALCFFSVYKMAIDTIFLNIMYDLKYNDGTPEKPYRAKKSLLTIVGKKNKKKDVED